MAEEVDVPSRKKRDPILMIGAIVLALAFLVVISGYVIAQFAGEPGKEPAAYGDKVKVDYVGSFYGYYDEGGHVFDTSRWDVASDDSIPKSFEFTKKDEKLYVPFNVTIGSGGALADFENALIGLKPGDTVRISIEAAYGTVPELNVRDWPKNFATFSETETMSIALFSSTFGLSNVQPGTYLDLEHPYGWKSQAIVASDGIVTVTHLVGTGGTFEKDGLKYTWSAASGGEFTVSLDITFQRWGSGSSVKLIKFMFEGMNYFITDVFDPVLSDGTYFRTKLIDDRTKEITGMTLFFVITFVDYQ